LKLIQSGWEMAVVMTWVRLQIDLGWRDLLAAVGFSFSWGGRELAARRAARAWDPADECLITLSVRSGLDLLMRALELPPGSKVLFTALTVPGMVEVAENHGFIVGAVEISPDGQICERSLRAAIDQDTRMIVAAHLFGGRTDLTLAAELAQQYDLVLVEDSAQRFPGPGDPGDPRSDVVLHSFGPIKSCTALGGGVVRVRDPAAGQRMREILATDPVQSAASFRKRVVRFGILKLLSGRIAASSVMAVMKCLRIDADATLTSLAKGFCGPDLLKQLRHQPSTPLLRLLRRRWAGVNAQSRNLAVQRGRYLDSELSIRRHTETLYWVYPVFDLVDPIETTAKLRHAGFDATMKSRMICLIPEAQPGRHDSVDEQCGPKIVSIPNHIAIHKRWRSVVFVPAYAAMPMTEIRRMARIIRQ